MPDSQIKDIPASIRQTLPNLAQEPNDDSAMLSAQVPSRANMRPGVLDHQHRRRTCPGISTEIRERCVALCHRGMESKRSALIQMLVSTCNP